MNILFRRGGGTVTSPNDSDPQDNDNPTDVVNNPPVVDYSGHYQNTPTNTPVEMADSGSNNTVFLFLFLVLIMALGLWWAWKKKWI